MKLQWHQTLSSFFFLLKDTPAGEARVFQGAPPYMEWVLGKEPVPPDVLKLLLVLRRHSFCM